MPPFEILILLRHINSDTDCLAADRLHCSAPVAHVGYLQQAPLAKYACSSLVLQITTISLSVFYTSNPIDCFVRCVFFYLFLSYDYGYFTYRYVYIPHVCLVLMEAKKRASDPLEEELQKVVSHHVSAEN